MVHGVFCRLSGLGGIAEDFRMPATSDEIWRFGPFRLNRAA
jgi:hypothetical protein